MPKGKRFSPKLIAAAKYKFVDEGKGYVQISQEFGGDPCKSTIANWANKKDKSGKTWIDLKKERIENAYLQMSPNKMSEEIEKKGYHSAWIQEICFNITSDFKYNPKCLCDNTGCARHSNCKACIQFHKLTNHPPTCKYAWKWEDK